MTNQDERYRLARGALVNWFALNLGRIAPDNLKFFFPFALSLIKIRLQLASLVGKFVYYRIG